MVHYDSLGDASRSVVAMQIGTMRSKTRFGRAAENLIVIYAGGSMPKQPATDMQHRGG